MGCRHELRLIVALGLIACNDPSDPGDEARGFRVTAREPANGATGVPLGARVSATLSADVQDNSIPSSAIRITTGGSPVPSFLNFDPITRRIEVRPLLLPASTYRAVVSAEVRNSAGDSLVGSREWTFATRSWEPVAIPRIGQLGMLDAGFAPDGRVHVIGEGEYYFRPGNDVADTYVKYATCATACFAAANWSRVAIDSAWLPGSGMAIELDGSGVVHVVHSSASPAPSPDFGPNVIRYVSCPSACSLPGNWTGVTVDSSPDFTTSWPLTAFAASSGGELHLLSYSGLGGAPDLRYARCSADCTGAANWVFAPIPVTGYPSGAKPLQVDHAGRLHLLTTIDGVLTYSACAADCTSAAQWTSGPVLPSGETGVSATLATDSFDRLHVVYSDAGGNFRYAQCTGSCGSAGSWQAIRLDQGGFSGSELAVDPTGRVVVLNPVTDTGELRYLSCFSECLDVFSWQMSTVERPDIFRPPTPGAPRLATHGDGSVQMVYTTSQHDLHYLE